MWDLKPPFKPSLSSEKRRLWPFMAIAAVLHAGLIYGYTWRLSLQTNAFLQEGIPVNLIFLPVPEEEKQEAVPFSISSPLKEKVSRQKPSFAAKKSDTKEGDASPQSVSPSLSVPFLVLKRGNPDPPYPEEARTEGWEANVTAVITILPDGSIKEVQIISDSPACFVENVLKTVKQWEYYPHSSPSAYQHKVSFVFKLE